MHFLFNFIKCTQYKYDENIVENVIMQKSEDHLNFFTTNENSNLIYNFDKNLSSQNLEHFDYDCDDPTYLKKDVLLGQKLNDDRTIKNQSNQSIGEVFLNMDLETGELEELFCFETNINQLEESNTLTNNENINPFAKLLECKIQIKNFIERQRLILSKKSQAYPIIRMTPEKEALIRNYNRLIYCFKKDFIYNLNNRKLTKLSKIIKNINVSDETKKIIIEFLDVFKLFVSAYDKRKNFLQRKFLIIKNLVEIIRYNIEIMSIFNYIPIIETFENIDKHVRLKEYESDKNKEEVISILNSIKTSLHILCDKSCEIKKVYEKCIEILLE
ncbi:uncharacterized protein VNE69_06216 [Vairimorpha necatrix]|uniref:Uncharacterized protein n=1 Tax=Vairimorpha necatrix TaxID=6039 RepID=A0AAX4JD30_9MICR